MPEQDVSAFTWSPLSSSRIDRIPWPVAAFLVLLCVLSCVFVLRHILLGPYTRNRSTGWVTLNQNSLHDVKLKVEYPELLRIGDKDDHGRRSILISVLQNAYSRESVQMTIVPQDDVFRFWEEEKNGNCSNGSVTIVAPRDVFSLGILYISHPGLHSSAPLDLEIPLTVQIASRMRGLKQSVSTDMVFSITVEGYVTRWLRESVSILAEKVTFWTVLVVVVGGLAAEWWQRQPKMGSLYDSMRHHLDEGQIDKIISKDREEYLRLKWPFYKNGRIEKLYRRAAADFYFQIGLEYLGEDPVQSLYYLKLASRWDGSYVPPYVIRKVILWQNRVTWIAEKKNRLRKLGFMLASVDWVSHARLRAVTRLALSSLTQLLTDLATSAEKRCQIIKFLRYSAFQEMKEARYQVQRAFEDDNLSVRIEAAWTWARVEEKAVELREADRKTVKRWLGAFRSPLDFNPFEMAAEGTEQELVLLLEKQQRYEHPKILDLNSGVLFAPSPHNEINQTIVKQYYQITYPRILTIEYTDFSELVHSAEKISLEAHIQNIVQAASIKLKIDPSIVSSPALRYIDKLGRLEDLTHILDYKGICIFVSNVDGYAETQINHQLAEEIIQHIVGNRDLFNAPHIYFKLFLPPFLKERLREYDGFASGVFRIGDEEWRNWIPRFLLQVLRSRLEQASKDKRKVRSLRMFAAEDCQPDKLDDEIVRLADGSPNRLISLVNMLFQHRAQIWHEEVKEDPKSPKLFIQTVDWATLLEHLLRQGDVI